jgi:uncharacterized protein (TIGR02147 family)
MDFYKYDDYKEALKLFIRSKGPSSRGTFKNIAEFLGVNPTLVSQILSGPRHFSEEQIFSVCEFLGLSKLESQYLLVLVQIERAGTVKLRNHYLSVRDQIRKNATQVSARVPKTRELSETEKAKFYSTYLYSAIQIATSLEQGVTFDFICQRFNLSPPRAREIVNFLIEAQLVIEKEGRFSPGTSFTHLDKKSPFVNKHLTNWRLKAIDAATEATEQELFYSLNFSVSKKDFQVLRDQMVRVIQEFLDVVKASPSEDVAQFNLDLFWVKR